MRAPISSWNSGDAFPSPRMVRIICVEATAQSSLVTCEVKTAL
jgi:hypothetical protein